MKDAYLILLSASPTKSHGDQPRGVFSEFLAFSRNTYAVLRTVQRLWIIIAPLIGFLSLHTYAKVKLDYVRRKWHCCSENISDLSGSTLFWDWLSDAGKWLLLCLVDNLTLYSVRFLFGGNKLCNGKLEKHFSTLQRQRVTVFPSLTKLITVAFCLCLECQWTGISNTMDP